MSSSAPEGGQGQEPGTNGAGGQGQEPQGGQNGNQGQEPGASGQEAPFDFTTIQDPAMRAWAEKVDRDAKEAREQAARYRTERNTLQTQVSEYQRANETAEQAAQREAQERQERMEALERENRDLKVGTAIRTAAEGAKAFNPNLVAEMLQGKVTLGEDGQPANLKDLLADLRKSDPYLFKRAQADGGEGNGSGAAPTPTGNMNDMIRGAARARRGATD